MNGLILHEPLSSARGTAAVLDELLTRLTSFELMSSVEMADVVWNCSVEMDPERHVLNDRGERYVYMMRRL